MKTLLEEVTELMVKYNIKTFQELAKRAHEEKVKEVNEGIDKTIRESIR